MPEVPGLAVRWQDGPIGADGVQNGATPEDVIDAVIAHLEDRQMGAWPTDAVAAAIETLRAARGFLDSRGAVETSGDEEPVVESPA